MPNSIAIIAKIQTALARIELLDIPSYTSKPILLKQELYKSQDYPSFGECLQDFLSEFLDAATWPSYALIAVPGVPFENTSTLIDSHWPEINGSQISTQFGIPNVKLINSSVCVGLEILNSSKEEFLMIQEGELKTQGGSIVVGVSQYLGECHLMTSRTADGETVHQIFPTEGGLKKFSPTNENEWEYQEFLMKELPELEEKFGYLPLDKAFCGDAITNMYKYFCNKEKKTSQAMYAGEILIKGMNKSDEICQKTVEFFLKILGIEVSNFALETLPTNGIYLVGGYLSILANLLKDHNSSFMSGYLGKGPKVNEMLSKFPIYLVRKEDLVSSGCIIELKKMMA